MTTPTPTCDRCGRPIPAHQVIVRDPRYGDRLYGGYCVQTLRDAFIAACK